MRLTLAALVLGTSVGLPLLLIGGYIWQAGLDLHSPSSSREWIDLCARGREDLFRKTTRRVVEEINGPVVLIYPGVTGDHDLQASLTRWKGRTPSAKELDALVRANLFAAIALQTGEMRSFDGQVRQVMCGLPDQRAACRVDHLRVAQTGHTLSNGAIYIPIGKKNPLAFLPPLPVQ